MSTNITRNYRVVKCILYYAVIKPPDRYDVKWNLETQKSSIVFICYCDCYRPYIVYAVIGYRPELKFQL
jgi:hypothetical protein